MTSEKDKVYVRMSTFTWAIGLLSAMIVACVGWSFAAYSNAADARLKALELEIRLNEANHKLDLRLSNIETNTGAIKNTLERHEEETRNASSSRTSRLGKN
jgi:negative regulator of sigma E activity